MSVGVGVRIDVLVVSDVSVVVVVSIELDEIDACSPSTAVTVDARDEVVAAVVPSPAESSGSRPTLLWFMSLLAADGSFPATKSPSPFPRKVNVDVADAIGVGGADNFRAPLPAIALPASQFRTIGLVGADVDAAVRPGSFAAAAAAAIAASSSKTRFAIATMRLARRSNVRVISRMTWLTFQLSRLPSAISAYVRSLPLASGSGRRKTCVTL